MTYYHQEVLRIGRQQFARPHLADQLSKARRFMDEHVCDKIDLQTVAGFSFLSKFHFIRLFKRYYGITPHAYLLEKRLELASQWLRSEYSVVETCFRLGFESPNTFSATFKKYSGLSPTAYKKQFLIGP